MTLLKSYSEQKIKPLHNFAKMGGGGGHSLTRLRDLRKKIFYGPRERGLFASAEKPTGLEPLPMFPHPTIIKSRYLVTQFLGLATISMDIIICR